MEANLIKSLKGLLLGGKFPLAALSVDITNGINFGFTFLMFRMGWQRWIKRTLAESSWEKCGDSNTSLCSGLLFWLTKQGRFHGSFRPASPRFLFFFGLYSFFVVLLSPFSRKRTEVKKFLPPPVSNFKSTVVSVVLVAVAFAAFVSGFISSSDDVLTIVFEFFSGNF